MTGFARCQADGLTWEIRSVNQRYLETSFKIPDGVTSIGKGAFYRCTSLETVIIPDSVTNIGVGVFRGCTSLNSIDITGLVSYESLKESFYIYDWGKHRPPNPDNGEAVLPIAGTTFIRRALIIDMSERQAKKKGPCSKLAKKFCGLLLLIEQRFGKTVGAASGRGHRRWWNDRPGSCSRVQGARRRCGLIGPR